MYESPEKAMPAADAILQINALRASGALVFKYFVKKSSAIEFAGHVRSEKVVANMPPMTYAVSDADFQYKTVFPDGEVENAQAQATVGCFIIKGALGEAYTSAKTEEKLLSSYLRDIPLGPIRAISDRKNPRKLALYHGPKFYFHTSYGVTVCEEGDYLQDLGTKFSRVEAIEQDWL